MVHLATDQELLALLRASKIVKFIMIVGRSKINVCDDNFAIVHEMNELQIDPRTKSEMQIIVRNEDPLVEAVDLEWAEEPQHGITTVGLERVEEEEKEHYMDLGRGREEMLLPAVVMLQHKFHKNQERLGSSLSLLHRHSQTVVVCPGCQAVLCQPTGGKARLTEGFSFRRKND
ncbi:hypothetical protein EJB05_50892, partial [Eragrostis curvula]